MILSTKIVLAYHSINPFRSDPLAVHPDQFYAQMKWFYENGWTGLSLVDYMCRMHNNTENIFSITNISKFFHIIMTSCINIT